ncbi:DUF4913 domain-containing protein [Isoptericola rhizosphaerae]|uniref:DUF4913 domain-containing protein n=1 Tax=Isoptericola rhizosphaerae TaxID=3377837 RepID=UPI00383BC46A
MTDYITRDEHLEAMEAVQADIAKLVELVGQVLDGGAPGSGTKPAAGRWQWDALDHEARVELWYELRDWVDWYNSRYGYAHDSMYIPPCWPKHSLAVEELTALMVAWKAAQAQSEPTDLLRTWHERLYPAIERLHGSGRPGGFDRCSDARHEVKNTVPVSGVPDDVFAEVVREDVEAHHVPDRDIEAA